jgi:HAD superfamily hydrolase (TIGR01509 family)
MNTSPRAGLLFDIDGTLLDTDALHLDAFNQVFAPFGHHFDEERFKAELQGFSVDAIGDRFFGDLPPQERRSILDRKEAVFRDLAQAEIKPLPGLLAFLDWADAAGLPIVAVTNAPRRNAEMMLAGLGVHERFRGVVIGDELEHGKPHPLPYQEGLRLLDIDPAAAVAFEDSRAGIASATSAGIRTVGVRTGLEHGQLLAAGASLTIADYTDPSLQSFVEAIIGGTG